MKRFDASTIDRWIGICGIESSEPAFRALRIVVDEVLVEETYHTHPKGHDLYVFISGKVIMKIDDKEYKFGKGDVILIEPGECHGIKKIIEKADYVVIRDNELEDKVIYK